MDSTAITAFVMSVRNLSCIGQPEIVSKIFRRATPPSACTDSTIPKSGKGL